MLYGPVLPSLCPVSQMWSFGRRKGHGKLKRKGRGEVDQLHRDKTQASAMEREQLRGTRIEWSVTMTKKAVHRGGGTEDKD